MGSLARTFFFVIVAIVRVGITYTVATLVYKVVNNAVGEKEQIQTKLSWANPSKT